MFCHECRIFLYFVLKKIIKMCTNDHLGHYLIYLKSYEINRDICTQYKCKTVTLGNINFNQKVLLFLLCSSFSLQLEQYKGKCILYMHHLLDLYHTSFAHFFPLSNSTLYWKVLLDIE